MKIHEHEHVNIHKHAYEHEREYEYENEHEHVNIHENVYNLKHSPAQPQPLPWDAKISWTCFGHFKSIY